MRAPGTATLSAVAALVTALAVFGVYMAMDKDNPPPPPPLPVLRSTPVVATQERPVTIPLAPPSRDTIPALPTAPELPPTLRAGMQPPALPANLPGSDELREQFTLLRRFLELPPERLARIRESIERIEKMPPERRQAMLERLPPATRPTTTITIPANLRADLDALLGTLSQDERDAIMERAESYDSAGQAAYFDGLLQAARLFSNPE